MQSVKVATQLVPVLLTQLLSNFDTTLINSKRGFGYRTLFFVAFYLVCVTYIQIFNKLNYFSWWRTNCHDSVMNIVTFYVYYKVC